MTALPETFSSSLTTKTTLRRGAAAPGADVWAPAEAAQESEIEPAASKPSQREGLMSDLLDLRWMEPLHDCATRRKFALGLD
jgi:hypothetical protein